MLYNFFKIALRNIRRHASFSIINVLGLALGIACAVMIFSIVRHHLSFDNFHSESDRIYRIVTEQHRDDVSYTPAVPSPLGKVFRDEHTFAEKVARVATLEDAIISYEKNGEKIRIQEEWSAFAEPEFFDIFNFPLIKGDMKTALTEPNTVIVTERIARKYFGDADPIGKTFTLDNRIDFTVTGVLKDFPENTDMQSPIYFSYVTFKQHSGWLGGEDAWGGISGVMRCYTRLRPGVRVAEVEEIFPPYVKKFRPTSKNVHHYKLQPLADVHFNAAYEGVMQKRNLWVLSLIGVFLLVTACVNFINLATAQAVNRSKEVGIRKVLGSVRWQLFWQFILETGMITFIAVMVALAISHAALPYAAEWFAASINSDILTQWEVTAFIIALFFVVTFASGSYPGIILAGFKPVTALKGKLSPQRLGGFKLRRTLIVTQFGISQVLIIALIVIVYQIHFAKESDLGFDRDAVVMVPVGSTDEKLKTLRNEIAAIGGVEDVSLCYTPPSDDGGWYTNVRIGTNTEEEPFFVSFKGGDERYIPMFELDLITGRNVTPADSTREFVVNEAFVRKLNMTPEEVVGVELRVSANSMSGPVVGVVKDFHDQSFHGTINPIVICTEMENYDYLAVKVNMTTLKPTLSAIEKSWSAVYPELIYEHSFLDDRIAGFYRAEETVMKLIQAFAAIAILIGCMGLYGLVSFMATQKTKEIGIRKVLGSSIAQILWIFGKEFFVLIVVAFVFAAPLSWWLMDTWLQNFTYRIDLSAWIFVLAITATAGVALLTVGYQSLKAAMQNPVNSLRSE